MKKQNINAQSILNLHSANKQTRVNAKNFLIRNINQKNKFYMSFEEVGKCDNYIWKFYSSKAKQDAYWPFIDSLHTLHILRGLKKLKIKKPKKLIEEELNFSPSLEKLYQLSLKLKIK